ncbi:MAG TPA: ATP-binding protein [Nocardioides sp.]|nr:ATP-binding protein [Nocardioides sp.]
MNAERVAVDHELPPSATSAGTARRLLREALASTDRESVESAELAVSEIVTNALVHAGTAMRLRVLVLGRALRVELSDGSPRLPRQRGFSPLTATGRGLHLVTELVDRWGAYPDGTGKVVWFEIAEQRGADDAEVEVVTSDPDPSSTVEVRLLDLPVLMHDAWQQHAAALLREYMLYRLDDDPAALETHAAVSDALTLLLEQVPDSGFGDLPHPVLSDVTEPTVSMPELVLRVGRDHLDNFATLHQVLEQASELADRGELLTTPTQPEIRLMRHWICEQVWIQGEGGRPTPWVSPTHEDAPGAAAALDWDPVAVDRSKGALIAADDTNRIVAASDRALAVLGYADRDELVGRRLIAVIPWRYHQAHVAGFTLHLTIGRDALIGRTVALPFLRADGTELEVRMRLDAEALPNGRRVFTAELWEED